MVSSQRVKRLQKQVQQRTEAQQQVAKKAVGYCRVSTEEQVNTGFGLESQERAIRAFAESQGYELVTIIHDAGISGSTEPLKRSGFSQIARLAEEHAFSVLLVWKFDRLARNLTYAVTTVDAMREQYSVVLRSVTEPIDTATPMGETVFAILAGMAAQERRSITERTLAGKREKANQGGFAGGAAPIGYRRDKEGGLAVDPDEAAVVCRIHEMRQGGLTYRAIADQLNEGGISTKRSGKWHPGTIRYIIDNPKYQGVVEYFFRWDGEHYVRKEAQHAPII